MALTSAVAGHLAKGGLAVVATHGHLDLPNSRELHLGGTAGAA